MVKPVLLGVVVTAACCWAQTVCEPVATYSPCEIVFELDAAEKAAHPNPYWTVDLRAEVRSPRFKTYQVYAFADGTDRLVIRFAPPDAGHWEFRVTSNLMRYNGKQGTFTANPSDHPGFIRVRNVRHFAYEESQKPHLWTGDEFLDFADAPAAGFAATVAERASQKFNHLRGFALGMSPSASFPAPDRPNPAFFTQLDQKLREISAAGITADLILGHPGGQLAAMLPEKRHKERFIRYMAARYSAFGITWQLVEKFETYPNGRAFCKELGELLKTFDPMVRPRSTHGTGTSAPLQNDGWMSYLLYDSADTNLNAVERQLYAKPFVNVGFAGEKPVTGEAFRHRLWHAAMSGQYLVSRRQGVAPDDLAAMRVWHELLSKTRYWDMEPYFDVDGGRALALEGIEYLIYVEKPTGPIEILVEKHGYDIYWINPATGEATQPKDKDWKGDKFVAEPPSAGHDWILHLSRDGKKEGMLRSYKFEARPVPVQELETVEKAVPFQLAKPEGDTLSVSRPAAFAVALKRQTRATRAMSYVISGEVTTSGQGYRVLATGDKGEIRLPESLGATPGSVMILRVSAINANGKVYAQDRVFRLVP